MARSGKTNPEPAAYALSSGFGAALAAWYRENARDLPWRRDRDPYRVWLSEIMLQQTRVEAVKAYFERFLTRCPDIFSLAAGGDEALMKLWEGLGYYARARRLKETAKLIVSLHGGRFPCTLEGLRALPGIGPYTAGAIASICFDLPTPAVDGNVLRVVTRVVNRAESVDDPAVKRRVESALGAIYPEANAGDLTQGLMELGATVCLPNSRPKCSLCPVAHLCAGFQKGTAEGLPVRTPKKERREEEHTVFLLRCGSRTAVQKRPDTGLLARLFELPNLSGRLKAQEALDAAAAWNVAPVSLLKSTEKTHVFTHIVWHMTCYVILCARADARFLWADDGELAADYALPSAFRMFL
ncbi:MAG: A/G-specific adenine glycosylase [Clostridiaceae bacterium]|nr:A/G-specific adenine glycosylase [Eubacteriales bacterium]